jgi:hypothetical protein
MTDERATTLGVAVQRKQELETRVQDAIARFEQAVPELLVNNVYVVRQPRRLIIKIDFEFKE